jgi:hypothetical protein
MKGYLIYVPVISYETYRVYDDEAATPEEAKALVLQGKAMPHGMGDMSGRGGPVLEEIHVTWHVEREVFPYEDRIDLKWLLWSAEPERWAERAPNTWKRIEELEEGDAIEIKTAPRKEIRYGCVTITRTAEGYEAEVAFREEWDPEEVLVDTLGVTDIDAFVRDIPYTHGSPGVEEVRSVTGTTMASIMAAIDHVEEELILSNNSAWEDLEKKWKKNE